MKPQSTSDLLLEFRGYRLTTIEVLYSLPDYPEILQVFIWQTLDLAPRFPRLKTFLSFWDRNIDAKILNINISQADPVKRSSISLAKEDFYLS